MDIWFDVDAALAEVPVNIFPLIDDGDFKSKEESIAYNQAGMDLVWNFVTTAGAMSQTEVTPTTSGNYDWAHQGNGMYSIEITASGGASINNDTEGFGWFTGVCTGVLPWRSPMFGFRAAGLNDLIIDSAYSTTRGLSGTALPAAAADAAGGLPISDAGALDLDAQIKTDIDLILADTGTDGVVLAADSIKAATYDESTAFPLKSADTGSTAVARTGADSDTLETLSDEIAVVDGIVDSILADTGTDGVVLANDAITAAKIAANAITDSEIATGAITAAKFAANAITSTVVADGTITAAKFAANAITSTVVADSTIADTKIATGAITAAKFAANAITSTVVADSFITANKIASNAIAAAKIATGAITDAKFAAGAITSAKFATDAITATVIAADAIGASELAADAITEIQAGLALEATLTAIKGVGWTTETLAAIDVLIDAIKAKTDTLPATPADDTSIDTQLATIAGYLDTEVAAILADTGELQTDLANGGRLDLLIDAIKAKTDLVPAAPAAVGSAMTLADDAITAAKFDESTAFPLKSADAGVTLVARTGADSDTLETLSDQLDNTISLGPGATEKTYTVTVGGVPLADCDVWVTSNVTGATVIASGKTNSNGQVKFYLDSGATVYIWRQKSGYDFTNPDVETV